MRKNTFKDAKKNLHDAKNNKFFFTLFRVYTVFITSVFMWYLRSPSKNLLSLDDFPFTMNTHCCWWSMRLTSHYIGSTLSKLKDNCHRKRYGSRNHSYIPPQNHQWTWIRKPSCTFQRWLVQCITYTTFS